MDQISGSAPLVHRGSTSSTDGADTGSTSKNQPQQWKTEPPVGVYGGDEASDVESDVELGQIGYGHAIVDLSLRVGRYVTVVVVGLGIAVAYGAVSQKGIDLEHNVKDSIGSSDNAEQVQDKYNAITGNLLIAVSKIFEFYCEALIFPTLITYLLNCSLFPGDQPHRVHSATKHTVLFWAFRVILILVNVGTASIFVGHRITGVERHMVDADLGTEATNTTLSSFSSSTLYSSLKTEDVRNTILRSVVDGFTRTFEVNSSCTAVETNNAVPPNTFSSTSITVGFPQNDWNADFLKKGLEPTRAVNFTYSDFLSNPDEWSEKISGAMDVTVAFETIVQGTVIFERGYADSHLSTVLLCDDDGNFYLSGSNSESASADSSGSNTISESSSISSSGSGTASGAFAISSSGSGSDMSIGSTGSASSSGTSATRRLQDSSSSAASTSSSSTRQFGNCIGTQTAIPVLRSLTQPNQLTWENLLAKKVAVLTTLYADLFDVDGITFGFATYNVSPEMTLEITTMDIPMINSDKTFVYQMDDNDAFWLDPAYCGVKNCIAVSNTYQTEFRQELSIAGYVTDCDIENLAYDETLGNFFPTNCVRDENAVMLYGLGTYMTAEEFNSDADGNPQLVSPQPFISLSFAKLSWEYIDLADKYGAECISSSDDDDNNEEACVGLAVPINSSDTYEGLVMVGKNSVPNSTYYTFKQPLRLLGFNQPLLPDVESNDPYIYYPNYINSANIGSDTAARLNDVWNTSTCDAMYDAYITYVENNHFYLDRPLQPMYTAALYYLLQDGVATTLNKTDTSVSPLGRLLVSGAGALEKKIISFRIPTVSGAIAFVGCGILLLLLFFVLKFPTDRVKRSPDTTPAAQYVAISTDNEMYPELVHKKWLRFPATGDVLAMDDYVVDHIVLHAKKDKSKKLYL